MRLVMEDNFKNSMENKKDLEIRLVKQNNNNKNMKMIKQKKNGMKIQLLEIFIFFSLIYFQTNLSYKTINMSIKYLFGRKY